MENGRRDSGREERKGLKSSFAAGVAALVFLVIGYQSALFIHKASVLKILENKDAPDTVFVIDRELAESILLPLPADRLETMRKTRHGREVYMVKKESSHSRQVKAVREKAAPKSVENFRFDPNTVAVPDLVRLGFTERQAVSIDNYRKKGGIFRRKSDFAKSFVVADSVYARLEPYIDIPLLDINLADSAAFDRLPGIGGYFASEMIRFRRRLGGSYSNKEQLMLGGSYSNKEQLMDIRRFDREKFDALSDLITVGESHVRPYPLWTLPADSLKLHPYIGSYAARGIVLYRENNPREDWTVEALAEAGILKPEMAARLSGCLIEETF